jgi:ribosomal protein S27E
MADFRPNPVCAKCSKEMTCAKNGVIVDNGTVQWRGDKFKCPVCGAEVVASFGAQQDASEELVRRVELKLGTRLTVDNV